MSSTHLWLELGSATACLVTAGFAWHRYQLVHSGYNLLWFVAFFTTALADLAHGMLSFLHADLMAVWVPWTWAGSRLTLFGCLGAAIWMSWRRLSCKWVLPVISVYLTSLAIWFWLPFLVDVSWVRLEGVIARPLDLLLACLWAGLVAATLKVESAQIQAPQTFEVFALLGMASHLVMAFGELTLPDTYFLVAHGLKMAEYWAWAGAVWWEEHQAQRQGGLARVLQQRFQEHQMDEVWNQLQRTTRRIDARLAELSQNLEQHAAELRRSP